MIKAVIFDTDGMVVLTEMFSVKYCKEYNVPYEKIVPFFKNEFQPCLVGKADLKEKIKPYLRKWNWIGSVEDFLKYWFDAENSVDKRMVDVITKLKKSGTKCYLATNQEKYRTNYLMKEMNFKSIFDRVFSSAYIGYKKPQTEFFDAVAKEIKLKKNEVMFWDDTEKNVQGANDFGFNGFLYSDYLVFKEKMGESGFNI